MAKETVKDVVTALCGALTDLGCVYDCQFDNRGGRRSRYIFLRKPIAAKIRIGDHGSSRIDKDKGRMKMLVIDVGVGSHLKNAVSWQEAVSQIAAVSA